MELRVRAAEARLLAQMEPLFPTRRAERYGSRPRRIPAGG
jgi:hypothetical protein